jgi:hypothetical protein
LDLLPPDIEAEVWRDLHRKIPLPGGLCEGCSWVAERLQLWEKDCSWVAELFKAT